MNPRAAVTLPSPIGELLLVSDGAALVALRFADAHRGEPTPRAAEDPVIGRAAAQLREYFAGARTRFELALRPRGRRSSGASGTSCADPVRRDRRATARSPVGSASPGAARAVGRANGRNPIPVIVPCHRVIGADGSLTGFGGGLATKRALLDLEHGASSLGVADGAQAVVPRSPAAMRAAMSLDSAR